VEDERYGEDGQLKPPAVDRQKGDYSTASTTIQSKDEKPPPKKRAPAKKKTSPSAKPTKKKKPAAGDVGESGGGVPAAEVTTQAGLHPGITVNYYYQK